MTKKELRKIYLKKRTELPQEHFDQLNYSLCETLFSQVGLSGVQVLHTFLPIEKHREVNTWLIIDRARKEFPQLSISIPKINNQDAELDHYYFEGREQLETSLWDIPEPVKGVPTPVEKIDAVLVPLLAFDKQGHRLGYGRGFYDRFLVKCRPDCKKIGLSLFDVAEKIEGISDKDIALNTIVTPEAAFQIQGA